MTTSGAAFLFAIFFTCFQLAYLMHAVHILRYFIKNSSLIFTLLISPCIQPAGQKQQYFFKSLIHMLMQILLYSSP